MGDRVLEAGVPIRRREYRTAGGRLLFAVDEAAFWAEVAPSTCVRRSVLSDALANGLVVRWGCPVDAVRPQEQGVVVVLGDGSDERYDFVVGADGVHSVVRPVIAAGSPRPSLMTGASWRLVTVNPGVDCWTAWTGLGALCLMIPVAPGEVYLYAASNKGAAAGSDPSWLDSAFARFPEQVTTTLRQAISAAGSLYHSPVEEVRVSPWHGPGVVVLGDAAHAMGPVWAQGAALAMEDALVLARLLARSDDWTTVGAAWERLRRPRVEHVQSATDRMSGLARQPDWLVQAVAPVLGPHGYRHAYRRLSADPLSDPVLTR